MVHQEAIARSTKGNGHLQDITDPTMGSRESETDSHYCLLPVAYCLINQKPGFSSAKRLKPGSPPTRQAVNVFDGLVDENFALFVNPNRPFVALQFVRGIDHNLHF